MSNYNVASVGNKSKVIRRAIVFLQNIPVQHNVKLFCPWMFIIYLAIIVDQSH